jgi:hypothetical protein
MVLSKSNECASNGALQTGSGSKSGLDINGFVVANHGGSLQREGATQGGL